MNRPNYHPALIYQAHAGSIVSTFPSIPLDTSLEPIRRLLVLIPANTDYSAATRRIQDIARAGSKQVQLLGLCRNAAEEPGLRRELVRMASLLLNDRICAEEKVEIGTSWIELVKMNYEPGDVIVCLSDQRIGFLQRPLRQILESDLKATVYVLSDLTQQKFKASLFSQISVWSGFLATIVGFGLLQARVVRLPGGWLQSILLVFSIILELGVIWVWDGWFR